MLLAPSHTLYVQHSLCCMAHDLIAPKWYGLALKNSYERHFISCVCARAGKLYLTNWSSYFLMNLEKNRSYLAVCVYNVKNDLRAATLTQIEGTKIWFRTFRCTMKQVLLYRNHAPTFYCEKKMVMVRLTWTLFSLWVCVSLSMHWKCNCVLSIMN